MLFTPNEVSLLENTRRLLAGLGLYYPSSHQIQSAALDHNQKNWTSATKVAVAAFKTYTGDVIGLPLAEFRYIGYPPVIRLLFYETLKLQCAELLANVIPLGVTAERSLYRLHESKGDSVQVVVDLSKDSLKSLFASTQYTKRYLRLGLSLHPIPLDLALVESTIRRATKGYDKESFGVSGSGSFAADLFASQADSSRDYLLLADLDGRPRCILDVQKKETDTLLFAFSAGYYRVDNYSKHPWETLVLSAHLSLLELMYAEAQTSGKQKLVLDMGSASSFPYKLRLPRSSNSGKQHYFTKV